MSSDRSDSPLRTLLEAERRFYRAIPIEDLYSKLFFRTIFWFLLFTGAYVILSSIV